MKTILSFVFISFSIIAFGQNATTADQLNKKNKKKYAEALELIKNYEPAKAIDVLQEIVKDNPDFYLAYYKMGFQYIKLKQRDNAFKVFSKAWQVKDASDAKLAQILSRLYEEKEDYKSAISVIDEHLTQLDNSDRDFDFFQKRINTLKFRKETFENPIDIEMKALPPEINGPEGDVLPALNADGSALVYTKIYAPQHMNSPFQKISQEDLFIAYINEDGQFNPAVPISELNTPQNEGAHCFSQDGRILIFTACEKPGMRQNGCDLYISFKKDGLWSEPVNMGPQINTRYWESQPSLSPDNKTLYFSSNRKGGYGKNDIWKVSLKNGKWTNAINLGPIINTKENEASPFIHADNATLYFRSNGHTGMGDYDLFVSRKQNDDWTKPLNLGYPINTIAEEGPLFIELNGKYGLYSTDKFNEKRNYDIYRFELPEHLRPNPASYIKFKVKDKVSQQALSSTITITVVNDSLNTIQLTTDKKGEALHIIQLGEYLLNVDNPAYIFYSDKIDIKDVSDLSEARTIEILLEPINKLEANTIDAMVLKNIFFESGSANLLPKSIPEIKSLNRFLHSDSKIALTIIGHTDDIGDEEDNMELSINRAKAVYDKLLELGADASRLKYEGLGETQPLVDNTSDENRSINRRTEFRIEIMD